MVDVQLVTNEVEVEQQTNYQRNPSTQWSSVEVEPLQQHTHCCVENSCLVNFMQNCKELRLVTLKTVTFTQQISHQGQCPTY